MRQPREKRPTIITVVDQGDIETEPTITLDRIGIAPLADSPDSATDATPVDMPPTEKPRCTHPHPSRVHLVSEARSGTPATWTPNLGHKFSWCSECGVLLDREAHNERFPSRQKGTA